MELTAIPTASGEEHRVVDWVQRWSDSMKGITLKRDQFGNLLIQQRKKSTNTPLYITAHLDHPAFVVRKQLNECQLEMEFRGGVHTAYFKGSTLEVFDNDDFSSIGVITSFDATATPFKRVVVTLQNAVAGFFMKGDIARWKFKPPVVKNGLLHAPACDDLAGIAAALSALDVIKDIRGLGHVGVLLTRAEEIGFVGAIAAATKRTIAKSSRLLCLETSRSYPESPIGGGPILRVGDKTSVFGPELTNAISQIMNTYQQKHKSFKWQRKLMPGGTCESTAFCEYGYLSTCLCLPLGNYHNMSDVDRVIAKKIPAKIAPEIISVDDFHGLVTMLIVVCQELDKRRSPTLRAGLEARFHRFGKILAD